MQSVRERLMRSGNLTRFDIRHLAPQLDYFHNGGFKPEGSRKTCDDYQLENVNNTSWIEMDIADARHKILRYRHPHQDKMEGKPFSIKPIHIKRLLVPLANSKLVTAISDNLLDNYVFVTACSSNHFGESNVTVRRVRKLFPDKKIIFYDLGLATDEINHVSII